MEKTKNAVETWAHQAKKNAGLLVILGVVTVVAGVLAMAAPWVSGIGVAIFVGFALVMGGFARLLFIFNAGSFGQGALAFIGGVLALVAGVMMIARPGFGLATITLMLGAYILIDGIFGVVLAFGMRPEKGWGWTLVSAAMGVLLGILLLKEWPLSGAWAIGTLVGINMLFAGFSMISIGSAARQFVKTGE